MKTLLLLLLPLLACATPYARQWESRLWLTPTTTKADKPEIGTLGTDELAVAVVCTQFRQVLNPSNSVLAIGVQCRNTTDTTHVLDYNPIQVLSDSNLVVQPLPLDHVMYKFYGGDLSMYTVHTKRTPSSLNLHVKKRYRMICITEVLRPHRCRRVRLSNGFNTIRVCSHHSR